MLVNNSYLITTIQVTLVIKVFVKLKVLQYNLRNFDNFLKYVLINLNSCSSKASTRDQWNCFAKSQLIFRIFRKIQSALKMGLSDLGYSGINQSWLEHSSQEILIAMSGPSRIYHRIDHIFDVKKSGIRGASLLAVLYHDIVYISLDDGIATNLLSSLNRYIRRRGSKWFLKKSDGDVARKLSLVFGFSPTEPIDSFPGKNELLSALMAYSSLHDRLSEHEMIEVLACIEATIPFRPYQESFELLEKEVDYFKTWFFSI